MVGRWLGHLLERQVGDRVRNGPTVLLSIPRAFSKTGPSLLEADGGGRGEVGGEARALPQDFLAIFTRVGQAAASCRRGCRTKGSAFLRGQAASLRGHLHVTWERDTWLSAL